MRIGSSVEICKGWRYSSTDSSVMGYSPKSNDVRTEADESPLLEAVAREQLWKTVGAGKDLACSDL
jgi:hypothetical protein